MDSKCTIACKVKLETSVAVLPHCILPPPSTFFQICMAPSHPYIQTWCEQVIAYTILDINRTPRLNEQPMTPEQLRQLEQIARGSQSKPGMCNPIMKAFTMGDFLACLLYNT